MPVSTRVQVKKMNDSAPEIEPRYALRPNRNRSFVEFFPPQPFSTNHPLSGLSTMSTGKSASAGMLPTPDSMIVLGKRQQPPTVSSHQSSAPLFESPVSSVSLSQVLEPSSPGKRLRRSKRSNPCSVQQQSIDGFVSSWSVHNSSTIRVAMESMRERRVKWNSSIDYISPRPSTEFMAIASSLTQVSTSMVQEKFSGVTSIDTAYIHLQRRIIREFPCDCTSETVYYASFLFARYLQTKLIRSKVQLCVLAISTAIVAMKFVDELDINITGLLKSLPAILNRTIASSMPCTLSSGLTPGEKPPPFIGLFEWLAKNCSSSVTLAGIIQQERRLMEVLEWRIGGIPTPYTFAAASLDSFFAESSATVPITVRQCLAHMVSSEFMEKRIYKQQTLGLRGEDSIWVSMSKFILAYMIDQLRHADLAASMGNQSRWLKWHTEMTDLLTESAADVFV